MSETKSPMIIEDLFLTDTFLIKGRLPNKSLRLVEMLERIRAGDYRGDYREIGTSGEYTPVGHDDVFASFFELDLPDRVEDTGEGRACGG